MTVPSSATVPYDSWEIIRYEVDQINDLLPFVLTDNPNHEIYKKWPKAVRNAVTESIGLHTRILADVLLSRTSYDDDIKLEKLLPGFTPPTLAQLKAAYGGSNDEQSPYSILNKKLFHPDKGRCDNHDYSATFRAVIPLVFRVWEEVRAHHQARRRSGGS